MIKEVENARVLNFAPELDAADCQDKVVKLSLEELVELYEDEGDISYNKCGLPYRENFVYEIADMRGNAVSKISYDDTGMIRRITPYVGGLKNGVEQKFDASGNLTAEINYKQGIKNGTASGFFPTKEVAFRKRYEDGKVVGRLTCYFPTGEVAAEFAYKDGKKEGTAKIYGPNAREISFAGGEIVGAAPKDARRAPEPSKLAALSNPDSKCLDITSKLDELALDLEANANTVTKAFALDLPDSCRDFSSFKPEKAIMPVMMSSTVCVPCSRPVITAVNMQSKRFMPKTGSTCMIFRTIKNRSRALPKSLTIKVMLSRRFITAGINWRKVRAAIMRTEPSKKC